MDDDKSLVEKTIEAVKDFATTVTDATKAAMDPEPLKPGEELVMIPSVGDGLLGTPEVMPTYVVVPKKRAKKKAPAKKVATKKPAKKSAKKSKKAAPKKSAKKTTKKNTKKTTMKNTQKTAKKAVKKVAKKKRAKKSKR